MADADEEEKRQQFLTLLSEQLMKEHNWERSNFYSYHVAMWLSVAITFLSTFFAAFNLVPSSVLSVLAGFATVVLLAERKFMFPQRWRWHNERRVHLERIKNQMIFEGLSTEDASAAFNDLIITMERYYPTGIDVTIRPVWPNKGAGKTRKGKKNGKSPEPPSEESGI